MRYEQLIEKLAAPSWKRNWNKIGEASVERLRDAGIVGGEQGLEKLRRGTQKILDKTNGKIYRNIEDMYNVKVRGFDGDEVILDEDEIKGVASLNAGAFNLGGSIYSPELNNNDLSRFLKAYKDKAHSYKIINNLDQNERDWITALMDRHESVENLELKKFYDTIKSGKEYNTPRFSSHMSPSIVLSDIEQSQLAPDKVREFWSALRDSQPMVDLTDLSFNSEKNVVNKMLRELKMMDEGKDSFELNPVSLSEIKRKGKMMNKDWRKKVSEINSFGESDEFWND